MKLDIDKLEQHVDFPNVNLLSEEFHVSNVFNELLQSTSELICKYSKIEVSDEWLQKLSHEKKRIFLKYDYNVNDRKIVQNATYHQTCNYHIYLQIEYDPSKNSIISVEYNKDEIIIIVNFFTCKYIYTNTYFQYKTLTEKYFIKFCRIKLKHEFLHLTEMYAKLFNPILNLFNDKLLYNYIELYNELSEEDKNFILQVFYYMKSSELHARLNAIYLYIIELDKNEVYEIIKKVNDKAIIGLLGTNLYCFFQDEDFNEHSKNEIMLYINEVLSSNEGLKNIINAINKSVKFFKNDIMKELKEYLNNMLRMIYKALVDIGYNTLFEYKQVLYESALFNTFNIDKTVLIKFKNYLQL